MWRDIPFNEKANAWMYTSRDQLPASYRFDDWWSEDALKEEAQLAREHMIPLCFRGPPDGPGPGNRKLWLCCCLLVIVQCLAFFNLIIAMRDALGSAYEIRYTSASGRSTDWHGEMRERHDRKSNQ